MGFQTEKREKRKENMTSLNFLFPSLASFNTATLLDWELVGSEAIDSEILEIHDEERRESAESVLQFTRSHIVIDEEVEANSRGYHRFGLDPFDALHLDCAGSAGAVFLTTDDSLIKSIKKHENKITTRVYNPTVANGGDEGWRRRH